MTGGGALPSLRVLCSEECVVCTHTAHRLAESVQVACVCVCAGYHWLLLIEKKRLHREILYTIGKIWWRANPLSTHTLPSE